MTKTPNIQFANHDNKGEQTMQTIKVPLRFYSDHDERDLDTPSAIRYTKTHVVIDANDPAISELLEDAEYYAASARYMGREYAALCASAARTAEVIRAARR